MQSKNLWTVTKCSFNTKSAAGSVVQENSFTNDWNSGREKLQPA